MAVERKMILVVAVCVLPLVQSFTIPAQFSIPSRSGLARSTADSSTTSFHQMLPADLRSNLLLSVDVFDGSSIVDPVVVSGAFWGSLQRQIISVILGQFLAAVVFTILASFFATQLSSVREFVVSKIFPDNNNGAQKAGTKEFIRADSSEYQRKTATPDLGKLLICLAIDFVGSSSELIPILGEFTDIVTAPLAATLLQNQFGGSKAVFFFEFAEEILPFTDIIPFATLCWIIDTYFPESDVAGVFQLGRFRANADLKGEAIDVDVDTFEERKRNR